MSNYFVVRYAEEEDVKEISDLVLRAYQNEVRGGSYGFRHSVPASYSEIISDLDLEDVRWLVVETPTSVDGSLLACVRLTVESANSSAIIDIFAVNDECRERGLGTWLLRQLEFMMAEIGKSTLLIEIAECRTDIGRWLEKRGYHSRGGYVRPDIGAAGMTVTILQYMRAIQIRSDCDSTEQSIDALKRLRELADMMPTSSSNDEPVLRIGHSFESNALENAVEALFRSLHSAGGEEEFQRLAIQENEVSMVNLDPSR